MANTVPPAVSDDAAFAATYRRARTREAYAQAVPAQRSPGGSVSRHRASARRDRIFDPIASPAGMGEAVGEARTGSNGMAVETTNYQIRIPFIVQPGHFFNSGEFSIEGFPAQLEVREGLHILWIRRLPTEQAAQELLNRICPLFDWVALQTNWGIEVDCTLQEVVLLDKPSPPGSLLPGAQGFANEGRPIIFPEGPRIAIGRAGEVSVRLDSPIERFVEALETGLSIPGLPERIKKDRIRVAVEIFVSSFFEGSQYAKYLSRITVLEVLKEQRDYPAEVQDAVGRWQGEVREFRQSGVIDQPTANSLYGSLRWLKQESLGRAISRLVAETLDQKAAEEADRLYNIRHRIVHDGELTLNLADDLTSLTQLVQRLLQTLLTSDAWWAV
jgi:hypothetical protein